MANAVVIVESPAKAKTINKYLGDGYKVLASFGHIRDLPPKDGSVDPENGFAMKWELSDRSSKPLSEITKALKGASTLYLASDPDREGEAIAWHVENVLRDKNALKNVDVKRITFNEITKTAVQAAIKAPRELDTPLIDAYLARRALDYLVGFSLSPVLWRKLPGAKSAGRVQSVALRLICERENEIDDFVSEEYWTISAIFKSPTQQQVPARLTMLDGHKLDKFAITSEAQAGEVLKRLQQGDYKVASVEHKQVRRNPYPPFTTSTLQQEAARKLYFGATKTMRTAQSLYEGADIGGETVGLITYMRTDGVQMANEAIAAVRDLIGKDYGNPYLPAAPRMYQSKAKNAQEAHEAIRPTDVRRRPADVAKYLSEDELKLYTLIWQRTVASQMAAAVLDQVAVDIASDKAKATFRATGSVVQFPGFLSVYQEGREGNDAENDEDRRLPQLSEGQALPAEEITPAQHFTEPPPRYSEASLVKTLEELGIGRPSTYASIMQVLQDRSYVRLDKRRFVPEDRGRLVTAFLESFFKRYVEYDFTAKLEEQLDDISGGNADWRKVLKDFWTAFHAAIDETKELRVTDVLNALDEELGPHFFPPRADGTDPRLCPKCGTGRLQLKSSRFGAFIGCSNYPSCDYTRQLADQVAASHDESGAAAQGLDANRDLGEDPVTGLPVSLRRGPYGFYVQSGPAPLPPEFAAEPEEAEPEPEEGDKPAKKKKKPAKKKPTDVKRVSLPRGITPADLDLAKALKILSLPREIGLHPEHKEMIYAGVGRFGPYLKIGNTFKSIPAGDDVLEIGINRAVDLLAQAKPKPAPETIGAHPKDKKPITKALSRFGPYLKWGKVMVTVPKDERDQEMTLDRAVELLATKATGGKTAKAKAEPKEKKAAVKKPAAKKPAAKKAPAKEPAAKTVTKKSTKKSEPKES